MHLGTTSPARSLTAILADLGERHGALDLAAVVTWKAAVPGRRAIGCLPVFAPRELVWAAGALPVLLRGAGDRVATPAPDGELPAGLCSLSRSTLALGGAGRFDVLDGFLFPATCATMGHLEAAFRRLFPHRLVHALAPPMGNRVELERWWSGELLRLYRRLCELTGRPAHAVGIEAAVAEHAAARMANRVLERTRVAEPWRVPLRESYLVRRAGDTMPPLEHVALVGEYLRATAHRTAPPKAPLRLLFTGGFCEQPPLALMAALEADGCAIVGDDFTPGTIDIGVEGTSQHVGVLDLLAHDYVGDPDHCAPPLIAGRGRNNTLVERIRSRAAEAVLLAAPASCPAAAADRCRAQVTLEAAGIPYAMVDFSEHATDLDTVRRRVAELRRVSA